MMSTLGQVAKGRENQPIGSAKAFMGYKGSSGNSVTGNVVEVSDDLEGICTRCRHRHKNKNCFRQHPELRQKMKKMKGKAKAA